jgi:DNA invertase Pin-like site-specific DNA recombinase
MNEKIQPDQLNRAAYVYVRQSSMHQVHHHREGLARQYALADRAHQLGFHQVVVIDDDLGISSAGHHDRPGFGRLLTAVCQRAVGGVFAADASRLARNNRDWHHLIDLCAMTDTLLIDTDGIYDPQLLNDRLVLGLKGTISEFELTLLRQRARAAFEQKVKKGCVMWEVPVGFIRTDTYQIDKSPDRQVQQAIQLVFHKFRELGTARQTLLWFRDEQIRLPEAVPGTAGQEIVWRLPSQSRIHQLLRNPAYAGTFTYGRTGTQTQVTEGQRRHSSRHGKPIEEWQVLIHDHHAGYISWNDYLENRRMLEANVAKRAGQTAGAAKSGSALLSGL